MKNRLITSSNRITKLLEIFFTDLLHESVVQQLNKYEIPFVLAIPSLHVLSHPLETKVSPEYDEYDDF